MGRVGWWPVDKNEGVVKGEDILGGALAPLGSPELGV